MIHRERMDQFLNNTMDFFKMNFMMKMFLFVPFITLLLMYCGDLELNPGPSKPFLNCPVSKRNLHQSENLFLWSQHAQKEQS